MCINVEKTITNYVQKLGGNDVYRCGKADCHVYRFRGSLVHPRRI